MAKKTTKKAETVVDLDCHTGLSDSAFTHLGRLAGVLLTLEKELGDHKDVKTAMRSFKSLWRNIGIVVLVDGKQVGFVPMPSLDSFLRD